MQAEASVGLHPRPRYGVSVGWPERAAWLSPGGQRLLEGNSKRGTVKASCHTMLRRGQMPTHWKATLTKMMHGACRLMFLRACVGAAWVSDS